MLADFNFITNRQLFFGSGTLKRVPGIAGGFCGEGGRLLIVWGRHFTGGAAAEDIVDGLRREGIESAHEVISSEPSPEIIDGIVDSVRSKNVTAVLAVGGGSVLDGGKAVAAMLCHEGGVECYLEGVGTVAPRGRCVPMIAVPTTAGTGSEATKNAVITRRVADSVSGLSYKRSLRHDAFVPDTVVIDPVLALGCPHSVSLACGLDAFCQLLEAWMSQGASPFSDMVALEGLRNFSMGARLLDGDGYDSGEEVVLRGYLGMAAYCSGLVLANAGLGTVHGIAGSLGAYCSVPHGVACGLLLPPVLQRIWHCLLAERNTGCLERLNRAASIISGTERVEPLADLMERLAKWSSVLPRLSHYNLPENLLSSIAAESSNKSSPVNLQEEDRLAVLRDIY